MQKYYDVLGLGPKASLDEIKKAYRKQVVLWHPDKNNAPGAAEKFIEITEAYEFLVEFKTRGSVKSSVKTTISREEAIRQRKEEARIRAMHAAQMRYQEYIRSDAYLTNQAFGVIVEHALFAASLFFILILPVYLAISYGITGLISGIVAAVITASFSIPAFRNIKQLSIARLSDSFLFVAKRKLFHKATLPCINFFVFLKIGLQTMMPFSMLMVFYIVSSVICILAAGLYAKGKFSSHKAFAALQAGPSLVSVFLILNFFISFRPVTETYRYSGGRRNDNFIVLKGHEYENYPGIRAFIDQDEVTNANEITYTFKTGMFGIRVMRTYHFH